MTNRPARADRARQVLPGGWGAVDHAVALVQSYLRVNGFFTVTEYPILHREQSGTFREATDLDLLAVRLADAGRVLPRGQRLQGEKVDVDPRLGIDHRRREFLIAEVKEGEADPNRFLLRRGVLFEALRRFGFGERDERGAAVSALAEHGVATFRDGSRVRLVVFGSRPGEHMGPCTFMPLGHVVDFLRRYLEASRAVYGQMRFRDPAMGFLSMLDKAGRGP